MKSEDIALLILGALDQDPLVRCVARSKLLNAIREGAISVADIVHVTAKYEASGGVYRSAASILLEADCRSGKLIGDLMNLLHTTHRVTRHAIERLILAMAELPEWEMARGVVISRLIPALEHENPEVRRTAVFLLGALKEVSAVQAIFRKIWDPDIKVRRAVELAMFQLLLAVREFDEVIKEVIKEFWLLALSDEPNLAYVLGRFTTALIKLDRHKISWLARITAEKFHHIDQTAMSILIRQCFHNRRLCDIAFIVEVLRFSSPDTRSKLWLWLRESEQRFGMPSYRYPWPGGDHAMIVREAMDDPDPEIRLFATTAAALAGYRADQT